MDTTEQTPGIGHNQPSPFELAAQRVGELTDAANAWLTTVDEIEDDDRAGRAADFKEQLTKMKKSVNDERLEATKPLREEVDAINKKFNALTPYLDKALAGIRALLDPYLKKKDDERRAKEQAAREEAERKRQEAEELARKAEEKEGGDVIGTAVAADIAKEEAEAAEKKAASIAREKPQVKGDYASRATGFRTNWRAEIVNIDEAFAYYKDHPDVAALLTRLGSADARGGRRRIPGFKIIEERKVA